MPYGKGTYGNKVGRPKKKKGKLQAGKKVSKPRNPTGYTVPGARSKKKTLTKKPASKPKRKGNY